MLDAAEALIWRVGLNRMTVEEVAQAAGISKGTVYRIGAALIARNTEAVINEGGRHLASIGVPLSNDAAAQGRASAGRDLLAVGGHDRRRWRLRVAVMLSQIVNQHLAIVYDGTPADHLVDFLLPGGGRRPLGLDEAKAMAGNAGLLLGFLAWVWVNGGLRQSKTGAQAGDEYERKQLYGQPPLVNRCDPWH